MAVPSGIAGKYMAIVIKYLDLQPSAAGLNISPDVNMARTMRRIHKGNSCYIAFLSV
jgi:hypothetical protein